MFDEIIIRRLLKKELTEETYLQLSEKIKNDPRVVEHFIKNNPNNINFLSKDTLLKVISSNYDLVSYLDRTNINKMFFELDLSRVPINKEIYMLLDDDNRSILFNYSPEVVLSIVPNDEKVNIISRVITAINDKGKSYYYDKQYYMNPSDVNKIIMSFDDEVILSLLEDKGSNKFVSSIIKEMTDEQQFELCLKNDKFQEFVSEDVDDLVALHNAHNDLLKIALLHPSVQVKYYKNNKDLLRYASKNTIYNFLYEDDIDSLTYEQFRTAIFNKEITMGRIVKSISSFMNKEEQLKLFSNDFYFLFKCVRADSENFNLDEIVMDKIESLLLEEKKKPLIDLYNSLTGISINGDVFIYHNDKYQIARMIFDDKIIERNDINLLKEYSKKIDRETLIEILSNAYGEHIKEIFAQRPNLDLCDIRNFKILDKAFVDNFGLEFIHYMLSYDFIESDGFISVLAKDEQRMLNFKKYYDYVLKNTNDFDINLMSDILVRFNSHETLLSNINYDDLTDREKESLELILLEKNPISLAIRDIEDVDKYMEFRKKYFDKEFNKREYISDKKECLFEYITGRVVDENSLTIENLGLSNTIKVFNVDHIIRNESIITSMGLNNDEVSILLLLHKIDKINNLEVLNDTVTAVMNSSITPVMCNGLFDKIRDYYTKKFKEDLTSKESLQSMKKEYIEDIPVISFEGEPLNIICTITELNMSTGGNFLIPNFGKSLLEDWLYRERGSSSISTVLCSSDVSIYPGGEDFGHKGVTFAFGDDISIIAMGGSDISYTHSKNTNRHEFDHISVSKMRFSSSDEIKSDMADSLKNDKYKMPGEVTIRRKEEDIRKIDGLQKRSMPIGIYVVGDITGFALETAKAFSEYYKENGLGEFHIIKVNPTKYSSVPIINVPQNTNDIVNANTEWYEEIDKHSNGKRG